MSEPTKDFKRLVHDVKAACANLRTAADQLKDIPQPEVDEYLGAMAQQAESLVLSITQFKLNKGGDR